MVGRTDKPTAAQERRLEWLSKQPCVCCQARQVSQPSRTEVHHIVDRGYRKHSGGHDATLPLCQWHHRGISRYRHPLAMRQTFGPSLALEKRNFVQTFGSERDLLLVVDARWLVAQRTAA